MRLFAILSCISFNSAPSATHSPSPVLTEIVPNNALQQLSRTTTALDKSPRSIAILTSTSKKRTRTKVGQETEREEGEKMSDMYALLQTMAPTFFPKAVENQSSVFGSCGL